MKAQGQRGRLRVSVAGPGPARPLVDLGRGGRAAHLGPHPEAPLEEGGRLHDVGQSERGERGLELLAEEHDGEADGEGHARCEDVEPPGEPAVARGPQEVRAVVLVEPAQQGRLERGLPAEGADRGDALERLVRVRVRVRVRVWVRARVRVRVRVRVRGYG